MALKPVGGKIKSQDINDNFSYLDSAILKIDKGSPKGVFATLSALSAAYPKGDDGVYVVSADGKWYLWNGTAWAAGGAYQATALQDGSVEIIKLADTVPGKNKYNKATVKQGYLDPVSFEFVASAAYKYSEEYIKIVVGETYTINHPRSVIFYDESNTPKKGINNGLQAPVTFVAEYPQVRVAMSNANANTLQIEQGDVVTSFEEYRKVLSLNAIEPFKAGGGDAYDQFLNTSDDVKFNSVTTPQVNTDAINSTGAIPTGTLVSPPNGLEIGDMWADTTDSQAFPIVRVKL